MCQNFHVKKNSCFWEKSNHCVLFFDSLDFFIIDQSAKILSNSIIHINSYNQFYYTQCLKQIS